MMTSELVVSNDILLGEAVKMLRAGRKVVIPTRGNSMLPFIRGRRDTVRLVPPAVISRWQIVLMHFPDGRYVLHRVMQVTDERVTLMGDGNLSAVEHGRPEDVVGVVEAILRDGNRDTDALGRQAVLLARLWYGLLPLRRELLWLYRKIWPVMAQ